MQFSMYATIDNQHSVNGSLNHRNFSYIEVIGQNRGTGRLQYPDDGEFAESARNSIYLMRLIVILKFKSQL